MKSPALFSFTPSLMNATELEAIFVQREPLATDLVERIRESVLTPTKHHTLVMGSRGMGKTHLVSLIYHRLQEMEDLKEQLLIAWLKEEEWGITSFLDLLLRIFRVLQEVNPDVHNRVENLYSLSSEEAEQVGTKLLEEIIGDRTLLLIAENLDDLFSGLGEKGQRKFRAFLQNSECCTILATSTKLFNGVQRRTAPFYGFFRPVHLKELTVNDAVQMLAKIATLREQKTLVDFLQTPTGRDRVKAVEHLAGGNPRIYVIFADFLSKESLEKLVQPFMSLVDVLTPYYQSRMQFLSPQQRKIVEFLCDHKYPAPVKDISQRCFMTPQTTSSQLKDLKEKGYVKVDAIGRESFYELQEPLMRICLGVKKERGEASNLIVEFLSAWYSKEELQKLLQISLHNSQQITASQQNSHPILSSVLIDLPKCLQIALKIKPSSESDPRIQHYRREIQSYLDNHKFYEALQYTEKLLLIADTPESKLVKAIVLGNSGNHESAICIYEEVLMLKSDSPDIWHDRGVSLDRLERHEEALESFDKEIEFEPENANAWHSRGIALDKLGRYQEAIDSFDKALKFKPDFSHAWNNRGSVLLESLKRTVEALESFHKAIECQPNYAGAYFNQGVALWGLGHHKEAIESYNKALEIDPDCWIAWNNKGTALSRLGRYEEAIDSCNKALEIKPGSFEALNNRGQSLSNLGRHEEAINSFDKALELKPDLPEAWNNRGVVLGKLDRNRDAIESYNNALKFKPSCFEAWHNKGDTLRKLDCYQEAIEAYDKALEIKPDLPESWLNRGLILLKIGHYTEAIDSLDKVIQYKFKTDSAEIWNSYGIALFRAERYQEAIVSCNKALEYKSDFSEIMLSIRGAAQNELGQYEEAVASFDKALEIKPDTHEFLLFKSSALANLGQYKEAISEIERAIKYHPDLLVAEVGRAELLLALNWIEGAKEMERVLDRLKDTKEDYPSDAEHILNGLLEQNRSEWSSRIELLLQWFEPHKGILEKSLVSSCKKLLSPLISEATAILWRDTWSQAVENRAEFQIPLRLLNTALHYKQRPDDPRVFLELAEEERKILKQALGLEE